MQLQVYNFQAPFSYIFVQDQGYNSSKPSISVLSCIQHQQLKMAQPRYQDDPFEETTMAIEEKGSVEPSSKPPRRPKRQLKVLFILAFIIYGMFYWVFAKKSYQAQQSTRPRMKNVKGDFENVRSSILHDWLLLISNRLFQVRN